MYLVKALLEAVRYAKQILDEASKAYIGELVNKDPRFDKIVTMLKIDALAWGLLITALVIAWLSVSLTLYPLILNSCYPQIVNEISRICGGWGTCTFILLLLIMGTGLAILILVAFGILILLVCIVSKIEIRTLKKEIEALKKQQNQTQQQ